MNDALDPGGIYRFIYQRSAVPLDDSMTARRRLLSLFMMVTTDDQREAFVDLVKIKLGVEYPGSSWAYVHKYF